MATYSIFINRCTDGGCGFKATVEIESPSDLLATYEYICPRCGMPVDVVGKPGTHDPYAEKLAHADARAIRK